MGRGHGQRNEDYTWEHKMSHAELCTSVGKEMLPSLVLGACGEGSNPEATSPQIIGESGPFTRWSSAIILC